MDAATFAAAYPRDISGDSWRPRALWPAMGPAAWPYSHRFGQLLHDHLAGAGATAEEDLFDHYTRWLKRDLPSIRDRVNLPVFPRELFTHAWSDITFHTLNASMSLMWLPLGCGGWGSAHDRAQAIEVAQDAVALLGAWAYAERERIAGPDGDYGYFQMAPERRGAYEGMLHELDAALVLLEVVRPHPDLTVVPAPMQFDRSPRPSHNVDFVVVSSDGQAIGVQVKARVTPAKQRKYDPEYVVLVDSRIDLSDELARRVHRKRTEQVVVSWAGMICAERVRQMPLRWKADDWLLGGVGTAKRKAVRRLQAELDEALGDVPSRVDRAVEIVGGRVLSRFRDVEATEVVARSG